MIQRLLTEAGASGIGNELASVDPHGAEAAADWGDLRSEENYVGYERTQNFVSPGGEKPDKRYEYSVPVQLRLNHWALSGQWTMGREAILLNQPNGRIVYRFHARDLNLVMGPGDAKRRAQFRISIDGQPPNGAQGVDVDDQGNGTVREPRMYQLVRQPSPVVDRQFEIQFLDAGVEAFSFTFG